METVNYFVSLTDSIVAGNLLGSEALTAIGLIAPFLTFSTFVSSIVNSGTVMNYSYQIGRFDKRRALEFFSQGLYMALISGLLYAGILFVLREPLLVRITKAGVIRDYAREYFNVILLFFLLNPVSFLLDNLLVADGGEKLSAAANVILIVSNIVFSVLFGSWWGVTGVAAASVLSKLLFILIVCLHFFSKHNTLRPLRYWKNSDCLKIIRSGIVKASTYALEALTFLAINLFSMHYFPEDTMTLLIVIERFLGILTLFIGLSMAAQPLIGTLNGEGNTKALRFLMRTVCSDMLVAGGTLTLLALTFASFLVSAFGIRAEPMHADAVVALRIVSASLVPHAMLVLFFIYYYLMDKQALAFSIVLLKNTLSPLTLAVLMSVLTKSQTGLWIGLAASPVLSALVCAQEVYKRYSKELFPFLLRTDLDSHIYIFDFDITPENCAAMSRTAEELLGALPVSARNRTLVGVFIEDIFMLVLEKNHGKAPLRAECTMIAEPEGVRLILRDSGVIFNVTDGNALPDSFRQYVVANMMIAQDKKAYLTTTGYNRNEIFFAENTAIQEADRT